MMRNMNFGRNVTRRRPPPIIPFKPPMFNHKNSLTTDEIAKRSVDLTLGIIVIILNIIEIILILRLKRKKKTFEIVLLSLCIADLMFGLSNAVISTIYLGDWKGKNVTDINYTTYFLFVLTSIFHLLYIAFDRLWAIVRPFVHRIFMTRKKTYFILVTIWVLTICIALTIYLTNEYDILFEDRYRPKAIRSNESMSANRTNRPFPRRPIKWTQVLIKSKGSQYKDFMSCMLSYFILAADILLVLCYSVIIYKIKSSKKLQSNQLDSRNKVSMVCVLVAGFFIALTLPYAVKTLGTEQSGFEVNMLLISNSGMNSVIYFFRNKLKDLSNKDKKNTTSSGLSASSTPLSNRREINNSGSSTPVTINKSSNQRRIEELKLSEIKSL